MARLNMEEYFRTALEDKLLVKMPEREDDFLTPATRMLEKRREMAEVEQALLAQKEEFQMKMESIQQRREELERKEEQLKDSIFKFDRFLKENDSKRSRAVRKANEERQLTGQKEKEATRIQQEITQLGEQKERLQQRMARHAVFQKYLERVLEKSDEFQEVREMIDRFNTLVATQANLLRREIVNQEAMEHERAMLFKYVEEKHSEILQDNNELAQLQTGLETAHGNLIQLESKWTHIQNTAAQKTLTIGLVKMATYNLFQIFTKQMHLQANIPMEDTEGQLDKIGICLGDMTDIFADLRKAETASRQALSTAN